MPAQIGSAVFLQYGNQGVQQPGNVVLLSYDQATDATTRSIRSGAVGKWVAAAHEVVGLLAPQSATARNDQNKDAPWVPALAINDEGDSSWVAAKRTDDARDLPYGAFGEMMNEDRGSRWVTSKATDDQRSAMWSIFGEMLNEDRGSKWFGSKAVDAERKGGWQGHLIPTKRIIPYVRPSGLAANFAVIGGGITAQFGPAGYTPPIGDAILFQFGNEVYVAPPMRMPGAVDFVAPDCKAVNFLYNPQFELRLDGTGAAIYDKATRDSTQINPWGEPRRTDRDSDHPWTKYSRPLNPGWGVVVPGGPPAPTPGETITVPVQRVYIVINEIQLLRVSNSTPIKALNINISFDCDSWLPSFSATIPESARDAVMPDPSPVEIEASINGSQFRFFVEKISRSRQFGQNTVSISGRGIACELDAPYAVASQHTNGSVMNAQQLIDAALEYTDYTQTWNITDWSVPANAFSLYGTAANVAASVAEASGSVLAADWSMRDLRMLPRYPVKPWDWATATPEYVIPSALAQTESLEWIEKPSYNVVYVSGVQEGVLGQVKITGTAGDLAAPMVTHPLITHADAARQRGISILGDTGRKAMMQISLPVLESTGVIDICRLIEFSDGANTRRGIVRANNISVNWPTVRQTLTVEAAA